MRRGMADGGRGCVHTASETTRRRHGAACELSHVKKTISAIGEWRLHNLLSSRSEGPMRRRTAAEGTSTRRPKHSLGPSGRCHLKFTRQRCPMTPLHPTTLVFFVNLPRPHTHTPGSVSDLRGRGVRWPHHIPHTTPPPLALFAFTTRLPWLLPPAPTLDRAATC